MSDDELDRMQMRVQITYDTERLMVGIQLTDQVTGEAMLADIEPELAMNVGDKLFKLGANMRAARAKRA